MGNARSAFPPFGPSRGTRSEMARTGKLSAVEVTKAKGPAVLHDGGGLYLRVSATGAKSWVFRFQLDGKRRDMGLGPFPDISLAEARGKAISAPKAAPSDAKQRLRTFRESLHPQANLTIGGRDPGVPLKGRFLPADRPAPNDRSRRIFLPAAPSRRRSPHPGTAVAQPWPRQPAKTLSDYAK